MSVSEQTFDVSVAGDRLRVRTLAASATRADRAQATLVFLHDALGSIDLWRDFPAVLASATGLPALLYDRRGSGGSAPLAGPRSVAYLDEETTLLSQLLEACGIDRPILVGHSDGATIALLYAAAYPDQPLAVLAEAPHLFVEELTLQGIRKTVARYRNTDLRARLMRYHGAQTDALFAAWAETWLDPGFRKWNVVARMPAIRCPVLVLQGEDDEYGSSEQLAAVGERVAGASRLSLLPECGHVPHHQARERVLEEMTGFLAGLLNHASTESARHN